MTTKGATGLFFSKFSRAATQTMETSFHQARFRPNATVGSEVIGAYHADVFCIPLPTHARLARITARMSIEPRLETLLVDRQLHHLRSSAQFADGFSLPQPW